MTRMLPNLLTALRIPLSLALLFVTPLGSTYLLLYALAGVTDMLDGLLARRLHAESTFGSRLDTVADMTMIAAAGITLWPFLPLNGVTIACIAGIALLKMASLLIYAIRRRKLLSHHSVMNKLVGFALFIYPLTLTQTWHMAATVALLFVATVAALEEFWAATGGRTKNDGSA